METRWDYFSQILRSSCWGLILLLSVLCGVKTEVVAQVRYPVHASVQVLPPYGLYLSDYYNGATDRLVITLLNRDIEKPQLQVRLRLQIKNSTKLQLQSREEIAYPPLELSPNVPLRLSSQDLAPYLRPEHLSLNGRLDNGRLPIGMTEFAVQVVEYYTGKALSQWHTGRAWLDIKKPPYLNLPTKDESVAYRLPYTPIRFQWMPQHQGLASTEYEFILKELPDNGVAPQSAYPYGIEIYRTIQRQTNLQYGAMHPQLEPNKRYAWQVRAIAKSSVDEIGMFDNQGFSEIGWFNLRETVSPPRNLKASPRYPHLDLTWQGDSKHQGYVIQYRPIDALGTDWAELRSFTTSSTLQGLKLGGRYEIRVGALGSNNLPSFCDPIEATIPTVNVERLAKCGEEVALSPRSQDPHTALQVGDTIVIGPDFKMTATKLQALGDGWYSGEGTTLLSWLFEANVSVRFDRLRVNINKEQIAGRVDAKYDKRESDLFDADIVTDGGQRTDVLKSLFPKIEVNFEVPPMPIASFDAEAGEVLIYDTSGKPQKLDVPKNPQGEVVFPFSITDKAGNSYQISEQMAGYLDDTSDLSTSSSHRVIPKQMPLKVERIESSRNSNNRTLNTKEEVHAGDLKHAIISTSKLSKSYYFTINEERVEAGQVVHVAQSIEQFKIELHTSDGSLPTDLYFNVERKEYLSTSIIRDFSKNFKIKVKQKNSNSLITFLEIKVHKSPYVEFRTLPTYHGEFGFDNGELFSENNVPKQNGHYHTIKNTDGKVLYCPFITLEVDSTIFIQAKIINKIEEYEYSVESSTPSLLYNYNESSHILSISSKAANMFNHPNYIYFYRKHPLHKYKELMGKCEIVSMRKSDPIHVQIMNYKYNGQQSSNNTVLPRDIESILNQQSLNQAFKSFSVNPTIYELTDTIQLSDPRLSNSNKAYQRIIRQLMYDKALNPQKYRANTMYVIMTDLVFTTNNGHLGGGVLENYPFAVMWNIPKDPNLGSVPIPPLIAHEAGHIFGLLDTFNDPNLGNPPQGTMIDNYMDYVPIRKMFFKSQIETMYKHQKLKE